MDVVRLGIECVRQRRCRSLARIRICFYAAAMRTLSFQDERPRERLARVSARGLSLRELIALLLSSGPQGKGCMGLAADLLCAVGGGERALFTALESDLFRHTKLPGLGEAMRSRLLAALELGRRYSVAREDERVRSSAPPPNATMIEQRALQLVDAEHRTDSHEWFGFIPVLRNGSLGQFTVVARGGRNTVSIDPQELFLRILSVRPSAIILLHNHPSGDLEASSQDRQLTRSVAELAASLGIVLLAHWVVGPGGTKRI